MIGNRIELRSDDGPNFIAVALADWAGHHGLTLEFINQANRCKTVSVKGSIAAAGKLLDMFVFQTLIEVREQTENVAQGVQRGPAT